MNVDNERKRADIIAAWGWDYSAFWAISFIQKLLSAVL